MRKMFSQLSISAAELVVYGSVVLCAAAYLFYETYQLSELHTSEVRGLLSEGWIGGRLMDRSDIQWNHLRSNLHILAPGLLLYVAIGHFVKWAFKGVDKAVITWYMVSGLGFGVYLHGYGLLILLAEIAVSYAIGRAMAGRSGSFAVTWLLHISFIVINNFYMNKVDVAAWFPALGFIGVQKTWFSSFNMVQLRLISYNLDLHWCKSPPESHSNKIRSTPDDSYSSRVRTSLDVNEYSFMALLAFVFYIPLYLAGPLATFNAFISHTRSPQRSLSARGKLAYAARWVFCFLVFEVMCHYLYVWALARRHEAWSSLTGTAVAGMGYYSLKMLWLKFTVIWRFFRLFALLDDVEVPENMLKCMSNNNTFQGFWRNWHASYNKWLVRYMYIPLGGNRAKFFNIIPIFLWVAVWHDVEIKLAVWGVCIIAFLIPEMVAQSVWRLSALKRLRTPVVTRYVAAAAGSVNIMLLMIANLIGFGAGVETVVSYVRFTFSMNGLPFLLSMLGVFSAAVHLQVAWEEWEKARALKKAADYP